ncbi:diaminopimelate epimerase [Arthrobacter sp. UM1]|uniref:diaminopimelate epimerase n=1 Tax=Arthrobacter sp. UM1 TaxID=2766776 RepID=UPI001CF6BCC5|nr:diaminopimelate epimerase [Arthrobacter sp. UM1]MCB4208104.1 diaminopimelate epimerase [Arthrobacter sp. UM1]
MTARALTRFALGHGTGNDFVLLTDPENALDLPAARVAAWCDRRRGLGGDGLIRAVRTRCLPEGEALLEQEPQAEWFMDYRNADGSVAEMCGNGVRVFIHYLRAEGLIELAEGEEIVIGTRGGVKSVVRVSPQTVDPEAAPDQATSAQTTSAQTASAQLDSAPAGRGAVELGEEGHYAVDLGPWTLAEPETAAQRGADALVEARGLDIPRPGVSVDMGNPHTVVALAHEEELEQLDLASAPGVEPAPASGSNVEFVVPMDGGAQEGVGEIRMRVFERGVGETLSCGTGAAAAAAATMFWGGAAAPKHWLVDIPGGRVRVSFQDAGNGTEHAVLAGPAVIVARGDAAL